MTPARESRPFRSDESFLFEAEARDAVLPFLRSRGLLDVAEHRRVTGTATAHRVTGRLPSGEWVDAKVKLCWHRHSRNPRERLYSATQLKARRSDDGWDATLTAFAESNAKQGITHLLVAQPERGGFSLAALIPIGAVRDVWWRQHDMSRDLINARRLGRQTKNHAANGHSPTLWLQDDRTPDGHLVADELWTFPGVIDLTGPLAGEAGDTFDDCPGAEPDVGSDGGARIPVVQSRVARDPRVRARVRQRAKGICERCGASRPFANFLDVHHVMGVEKSDRVWTCVAICPNCHREAHFSPDANEINALLAAFAATFKPHAVGS